MTLSASCPTCQCSFGPSSCVHIDPTMGASDNPVLLQPTLDEATTNLAECGPAGLGVFLPPYLLDPPACNIYRTIDQTMPYDTPQPIFFNEERYDTDSMHDTEADTSRLTFKTAGIYLVTLNVRWKKATVDSGDVAVFIRRNGADFLCIDSQPIADPDLFCTHSCSIESNFAAGDYVEGLAKQDALVDDEGLPLAILADYHLPSLAACFLRPSP